MATHKKLIEILTLGQAVELHENGIALKVYDGKEVIIVREKEPTADQSRQALLKNI